MPKARNPLVIGAADYLPKRDRASAGWPAELRRMIDDYCREVIAGAEGPEYRPHSIARSVVAWLRKRGLPACVPTTIVRYINGRIEELRHVKAR